MIDFSDLRRSFSKEDPSLTKNEFQADPIKQCSNWLELVKEKKILDGNAMTLSTSSKEGEVSSRTVLLKYLDERGFVFFTNYTSLKGQNLEENPKAALTFYWPSLNRQICIQGIVEKLPLDESEKYFRSRPRLNQLLALSSKQDEKIDSIQNVLDKVKSLDEKHKDSPLPMPSFWGGYLVRPYKIEFWQGGQGRVNLRFCYLLKNDTWKLSQLSP